MEVVVVANRDDQDPGFVGEHLAELGASLHCLSRDDPSELARAELSADLLLLLGSDWSVYDPSNKREVRAEQELVLRAEDRGVPIFAICYGAQLVASALGSLITRALRPEIGWVVIESDDEQMCPSGPWFQFHHDRWNDGIEARTIADSAIGPQAFWHRRTFAAQFHPEAEPKTVTRWLEAAPSVFDIDGVDLEEVASQTAGLASSARTRCDVLVDRFLATAFDTKI